MFYIICSDIPFRLAYVVLSLTQSDCPQKRLLKMRACLKRNLSGLRRSEFAFSGFICVYLFSLNVFISKKDKKFLFLFLICSAPFYLFSKNLYLNSIIYRLKQVCFSLVYSSFPKITYNRTNSRKIGLF